MNQYPISDACFLLIKEVRSSIGSQMGNSPAIGNEVVGRVRAADSALGSGIYGAFIRFNEEWCFRVLFSCENVETERCIRVLRNYRRKYSLCNKEHLIRKP